MPDEPLTSDCGVYRVISADRTDVEREMSDPPRIRGFSRG